MQREYEYQPLYIETDSLMVCSMAPSVFPEVRANARELFPQRTHEHCCTLRISVRDEGRETLMRELFARVKLCRKKEHPGSFGAMKSYCITYLDIVGCRQQPVNILESKLHDSYIPSRSIP